MTPSMRAGQTRSGGLDRVARDRMFELDRPDNLISRNGSVTHRSCTEPWRKYAEHVVVTARSGATAECNRERGTLAGLGLPP
jgi:hypothetical protein